MTDIWHHVKCLPILIISLLHPPGQQAIRHVVKNNFINITSFHKYQMQLFLWQIATVIPVKGTRTSVNIPGFQTKSLTITIVCGNDF